MKTQRIKPKFTPDQWHEAKRMEVYMKEIYKSVKDRFYKFELVGTAIIKRVQ